MKNLLAIIMIISSTTSCAAQKRLREYYYPISNKIQTKVYKYVDKNDASNIEYWQITTYPETGEIKTISYDSEFKVYNTFDEVITETGAELVNYSDFEKNDLGNSIPVTAEVVDKNVFKWNGDKEYSYFVKYKNQFGRFEFKKKRTELGFEKITVSGKEYNALKFKGDYSINALDQNDSYGFYQFSFYSKNIGMVKYERYIPNKIIELELDKILTQTEFKKLLEIARR